MGRRTFWSFCAVPFSADWATAGVPPRTKMAARIGCNETRRSNADQESGKAEEARSEGGWRQSKWASKALEAIRRIERGGRGGAAPARRGGEQGLGVHQVQQPAGPRGPPRDPGRR